MDRRTKVMEFHGDEATEYAVLSRRWIDPHYEEMVDLAKVNAEDRSEIRQRLGYKKILDTRAQAVRDGYEWVCVDTCCMYMLFRLAYCSVQPEGSFVEESVQAALLGSVHIE